MRWLWTRRAEHYKPMRHVNRKVMELETAKEILAEIFNAQPADVEEMIQNRLEERSWPDEMQIPPKEHEDKLLPATFCLGE
jgi:hypothetical protein